MTLRWGALPAATGSPRSRCSATADPQRPTISPRSSPRCSDTSRTGCRRPPLRASRPHASRAPARAGAVAARILVAERPVGGRARAPLRVRGLHQPPGRTDRRQLPPAVHRDGRAPGPQVAVAVWALCAPSKEEAEHLAAREPLGVREAAPAASSSRCRHRRRPSVSSRGAGRARATPPPRCARNRPEVREELERIALDYRAQEVIVVTITHDHAMAPRSYEFARGRVRAGPPHGARVSDRRARRRGHRRRLLRPRPPRSA